MKTKPYITSAIQFGSFAIGPICTDSVLRFCSVNRGLEPNYPILFRFLRTGNRTRNRNFRFRLIRFRFRLFRFGSRLFWFGSGSNQTNRIFSEDLKTIINILVLRQIYATLYSFLIIIIYKKTIAI